MCASQNITQAEILSSIQACEIELEQALSRYEQPGQLEMALQAYWQVEVHLDELRLEPHHPAYPRLQAVLAQCLLRQSNILRQFGQLEKAAALSEKELNAARASGDPLTLARSLMSFGATRIVHGELESGIAFLEDARQLLEGIEADDFKQALGWFWILRADLDNARITPGGPNQALAAAAQALKLLEPLENWPGIARAWAAQAVAAESLGDLANVALARQAEAEARNRIG